MMRKIFPADIGCGKYEKIKKAKNLYIHNNDDDDDDDSDDNDNDDDDRSNDNNRYFFIYKLLTPL